MGEAIRAKAIPQTLDVRVSGIVPLERAPTGPQKGASRRPAAMLAARNEV